MELRANQQKCIVTMADFNMRIAEVVGDYGGSRNKGGEVLVQWVDTMDFLTGHLCHQGMDMDGRGEEKCYTLHYDGGILGEEDVLRMQVEDWGWVLKYQWPINSFAFI